MCVWCVGDGVVVVVLLHILHVFLHFVLVVDLRHARVVDLRRLGESAVVNVVIIPGGVVDVVSCGCWCRGCGWCRCGCG